MTPEPVLCYVDDHFAYFTTQELSKQWGDDWNDAPYEHNAGEPYEYRPHLHKEEPWEIVKAAFDGPFTEPKDEHSNSPYSVEMINQDEVPWLETDTPLDKNYVRIPAGTTLSRFCELIKAGGGNVYLKA